MSSIKVVCFRCSASFERETKEVIRSQKFNRKIFCSRSCSAKHRNSIPHIAEQTKKIFAERNKQYNPNNQYARKGNFTAYLRKARGRPFEFDLDEQYLSDLWLYQKGKCVLTGVPISLKTDKKITPTTASLDRINSAIGYIKGNVQFVAYSANLAKNLFSDAEIKLFFSSIIEHQR